MAMAHYQLHLLTTTITELTARRDALAVRLDKGFGLLRAKEEAHDTGVEYEKWLAAWLKLEQEYRGVCDQIAER